MKLARVQFPEKDVFVCRIEDPEETDFAPGDFCLVELDYGKDMGKILELFSIADQEAASGKIPSSRVLRKAQPEDHRQTEENRTLAEKAARAFMLSACHERGNVRMLHARFSLDRQRLFIRYSAQMKVDLRRFQRQIERDYHTRMDLQQTDDRKEAALLGGMGPCGRPCCCATWQNQFPPVNLRMAQEQEMSLIPVSVEGLCGQLKCCLHFEYDQYRKAGLGLPDHGARVSGRTTSGQWEKGVVVARDVMRGILTIETKHGRFVSIPAKSARRIGPAVLHGGAFRARRKEGEKKA